ncbi:site-specific integrase [Magnetospirillum sp. 15-1]|uniref:site-specific integrase n=1 Tax=Magnetospirillum sp. 15-1 TaxID=1979370 RepID=UPI000BBB8349|nr:site-specific integrase [Magnetospirillum sp. 15-1]
MATITARKNKDGEIIGWQAKIRRLGFPVQSATKDSKKAAEDWAKVIESEMIRGVYVDRSKAERTTFRETVETYIRDVATTHKGGRDEGLRLTRFLRDESKLAAHSLATLSTRLFEEYRDRRLKSVTAGTVKRELGLLHTVIESVRKSHGMIENPISDVRRPTVRDARDTRLQPGEEEKLLQHCRDARNPWLTPAVILALETALRRSELLALRWDCVDLDRLHAHIPDSKTGKGRHIPLSPRAYEVLWQLGTEARPTDGAVIGTTAEGLKQAFERARSRAKMEHFNFHDLRHEATSRLFERGWNIMEVASVTGHQDLQMLKRYTNLRASDLAKKMG